MYQPPTRFCAAVVDDDRLTRELVCRTLQAHGYDVVEGDTAAAALRLAQSKPDVMVLDLCLPDMSGLAVCRAIRGGAATESVPVVFLTAADDDKTIVACLESGASDYVGKPFTPAVLAARVDAAVRTHKAELARRRHTEELTTAHAALSEARAEMVLRHRLRGLGALAAGVAQEMHSPLNALLSSLQVAISEAGPAHAEAMGTALSSAQRIGDLVKRMKAIAGSQERTVRRIDLRARVEQICGAFGGGHATLCVIGPSVSIDAVDNEVREVLSALVENAVQATQHTPGAQVHVTLALAEKGAVVTVDDNGPGIADVDLPFLFDPFFSRQRSQSAGLGLAIAQAAARRHGGEISVVGCGPLGGARVQLRLPLQLDELGTQTTLLAELRDP